MAKEGAIQMENLLNIWNADFPDYQLTAEDLKNPIALMSAVFQLFNRLGIDCDAVLMPPSEKNLNENCVYYWDLIPVINMTRVINHLVSVMPETGKISISHFLQPTVASSKSVILLLFNLMLFNEAQLRKIEPYEEDLFNVAKSVKELEDKKNNMLQMLNNQVEEKAKRGQRMVQMEKEIRQLEEQLQVEEQAREQEKIELETLIKENNVTEVLLDQKRATKEGLLAERERKRALRVYDADDIRTQASQASLNVQEAEEKLNSLQSIIAQKENSLKILHKIKPNLDMANNLLHEISKMKESELSSLDEDSKDGELDVLNTEVLELKAHFTDVSTRRQDAASKRQEAIAKRHHDKTVAESALREAEEKDKKRREFIAKATQRVEEIKLLTIKYAKEKTTGTECIESLQNNFLKAVKEWEEALHKLIFDLKKDLEEKQESGEV